MSTVKIFICCHKPSTGFRNNNVYIPLHVNRAVSSNKNEMTGYVGDDSGDNISSRGSSFSEGTGIYWIWKNVKDVDYVGLIHYRRDFSIEFTNENIDSFFNDGTDVIMSKKFFRFHSRWMTCLMCFQTEDLLILRGVIRKLYPEYESTLNSFLRDYYDHPFNMVICKKSLYDKYAKWLFDIVFEVEKYIKPSPYINSKRSIAYMTELLTPVYFLHNKCHIKEVDVCVEGRKIAFPIYGHIAAFLLHNSVYKFTKNMPIPVDAAFYRGLEADGIDLDCR